MNTLKTSYRVLARKYRPESFNDLIGQAPMVQTLQNAFSSQKIAQAWMLTGVRGVGKTTTARILARALNYQNDQINQPYFEMKTYGFHCDSIIKGTHLDVIEMDAASHTGIDHIRDLIDQTQYKPVSARYKIYVIDEIHMLSNQAFNGLLKTLEEPPEHVKFIFATTEIRKVPITILSRCQRFDLRRIETKALTEHLVKICQYEKVIADENALTILARASEGSVRDALSLLDQAIAYGQNTVTTAAVQDMIGIIDTTKMMDLFEDLMSGNIVGCLNKFQQYYTAGANPIVLLHEISNLTHLVTRLKFTTNSPEHYSLSSEHYQRASNYAKKLSIRSLSRIWQMLLVGITEVEKAPYPFQTAEMLLIRLSHASELPHLEDVLEQLKTSGDSLTQPKSNQTLPALEPSFVPSSASSTKSIDSLNDILLLAEQHSEALLHYQLTNFVRFIAISSFNLEIAIDDNLPQDFALTLEKHLTAWTKNPWRVHLKQDLNGAQPTLKMQEEKKQDDLQKIAEADTDVQKIFKCFPKSKIISIHS